jgi:hypothetical protein
MATTIRSGPISEWTATSLRPTARWMLVEDGNGRRRLEMVWAVPAVDVPAVTASGGSATA